MLQCKKLDPNAILPTVAHPGEDLAYDLYARFDMTLDPYITNKVPTGIAAVWKRHRLSDTNYGLLIRDRSSVALSGLYVVGGVIDSGYRGEIVVLLRTSGSTLIDIKAGQKIAQMIPLPVLTSDEIEEVNELPLSERGTDGFGSTGN